MKRCLGVRRKSILSVQQVTEFMSTARHILALLKSHLEGDDKEFLSVAMQAAAHEARLGHASVAQQLRDLIDEAKRRTAAAHTRGGQIIVLEPRGELASLLSVQTPRIRLNDMVLSTALAERLRRVLVEQRQQKKLREHALHPRRKLLFVGPPGSGKTMTASALAGESHLPLFTIMLEGLITKFMGETAANSGSSSTRSVRPRVSICSTNLTLSGLIVIKRMTLAKSAEFQFVLAIP